jgi:Fe-S oxidoreductase
MWFDDPVGERVGRDRVQEIIDTGAQNVAVGCPFCLVMLNDGLAAEKPGVRVRDIAELLAEAVLGPETA